MASRTDPNRRVADRGCAIAGHPTGVPSLDFVRAAQALAQACRRHGWKAPTFRSPPGLDGADRTLRRRRDGGVVVAVRRRGRPWSAVLGDLVDGVVAVNRFEGRAANRCRRVLWATVGSAGEDVAA